VVALKWAVREMEERYRNVQVASATSTLQSGLLEAKGKGENLSARAYRLRQGDGKAIYEKRSSTSSRAVHRHHRDEMPT